MANEASELTGDNLYTDPYPVYARLWQESPVAFFEGTGDRFNDCYTVGTKDQVFVPSASENRPEVRVMGLPNVLSMTGEEHKCLREGIDSNLNQERVRSYVGDLSRPVVQQFLDRVKEKGEADLTVDLFEPISVRCIGNVIGLTETSNEELVEWFQAMSLGLQDATGDSVVWDRVNAALQDIDVQLGKLYEASLSEPNGSLMSHAMYGGLPEGEVRSREEFMPTMRVIILGDLREPGHAAANACAGLLSNPEQARIMSEQPGDHAMQAFDKGLRWIAPIGVTPRVAAEDCKIGDTMIPAGSSVAIVMASANRNESRYQNPDTFDMFRKKKPHVSFGFRPHFCSDHYLSRAMGEIALTEIFNQLPNLRLDAEKKMVSKGWRFRGIYNLPARWDA